MNTSRLITWTCATASLAGALHAAQCAHAQSQFLLPDRDLDAIFRARDLNNDGVIANPGEVFLWFSAANAAGTLGRLNPTTQAVSKCRVAIIGDQLNRNVYRLRDVNNDGDAQDVGESIVFADATNASGASFAFPTGAAFDSQCRAYIANAGNASGNDGIYRLVDLNADGDAQDAGEITHYVTDGPSGFGPGNGPYSPQEMFFDANDVGYLHNSSTNLHGIFRFADLNFNGRADDAGEMTLFFGAGNAAGITVSAGFSIEPDRIRPGAMYFQQTAAGAVDQIIRVFDFNNDNDAQDAGEAVLVYSSAAANFSVIDILCLNNGDLLLTDNSSITIVRLHDANLDGDFMDPGESSLVISGAGALTQARQIDPLSRLGDANGDGTVSIDDLVLIITLWGPANPCTNAADLDCSGWVNIDDLVQVITNWG